MKRICVDSSVLIHAEKAACGSDDERDRKCHSFLLEQEGEKAEILVPAPCVAELLVRVPESDHARVIESLGRAFVVVPFDMSAAVKTGLLQKERLDDKTIEALKSEPGRTTHAKIKVDLMVLGTALARGAQVLYAEDNDYERLSRGAIPCSPVPPKPRQLTLKGQDGKPLMPRLRKIEGGKGKA